MQTLHILNGEEMEKAFQRKGLLEGDPMIPFNEAMCAGETCETIFSDRFIKTRALTHGVSESDYRRITVEKLEAVFHEGRDHLQLWFDEDMFCQINLLTLLAWLDQIGYEGKVELRIVTQKFDPLASYTLHVDGYLSMYKQVLINRSTPAEVSLPPLSKGIKLYLKYKGRDNELVRFIEHHPDLSEDKLVKRMIETFQEYGLGDVQYMQLIRNVRASER
ncbi:AraC family transcriptional regulator [Halobacillus sp. HZG1]|uniref:AraC family transcriptional regulator n=1 Tax=Halobacillus sp. HZG1 TaxID=3111769 RepID=UPI002DB72974|nr:AraC family transcriptional regulator [Halobacillus sp. HZG1]MEC3882756.1 AraC family transcriptional regulator [Halobacillus sp. HZG1]